MVKVIEAVETMQLICKNIVLNEGKTIRLVPTMGSLHAGHASLIKRAIEDKDDGSRVGGHGSEEQLQTALSASSLERSPDDCSDRSRRTVIVIVSIFVNPLQFNDKTDLVGYPRSTHDDLSLCEQLNVDYIFMPKSDDILKGIEENKSHAPGSCTVRPPDELARQLEGKSRGDHFEGVLTIVCKLFNIIQPSRAYFGEKDFQQLVLVDKMVRDLNMQVEIRSVDTVREVDSGLPLSSRNCRLTHEQRKLAGNLLYKTLMSTKQALEDRGRQSGCSHDGNVNLDTVLLSSLLSVQCLVPPEYELHLNLTMRKNKELRDSSSLISVDYLELRCPKDLTVITFNQTMNAYDCQRACLFHLRKRRLHENGNNHPGDRMTARLLMSMEIGKVRLLDNVEVLLNL